MLFISIFKVFHLVIYLFPVFVLGTYNNEFLIAACAFSFNISKFIVEILSYFSVSYYSEWLYCLFSSFVLNWDKIFLFLISDFDNSKSFGIDFPNVISILPLLIQGISLVVGEVYLFLIILFKAINLLSRVHGFTNLLIY